MLQLDQVVADRYPPALGDVRAQAAATDEATQDSGPGQGLEVAARLAQLDAHALGLADPEALADQVVEARPTGEHVAPRLLVAELDPGLGPERLQGLGLDQGQVLGVALGGLGDEVAIADRPLSGEDLDRVHRLRQRGFGRIDGD